MVEMRGVVKTFKNAAGEFTALKGIDLTIFKGEFVSIVGKSGSGKSTLLNMITGIDHPTAGKVVIGGVDIYTGVSESERSRWRGRNLGIVFQFFQLLPMLTLAENVMLAMDYADLYDFDERPARALEMLKMVGLEKFANKLPISVSTGQQQLAAIARALVNDPPLLVADEPTGNLDSKSAAVIIDLFEEFSRRGKTIVMVTHDPSLTARTTRNIVICDGELVDEAVSRALPSLRHRHMLEITKNAKRMVFQPREVILPAKRPVEYLYIVSRGAVDVVSANHARAKRLAHLKAGESFGEIELLRGGKSMACVRASTREPVEALAYPRAEFLRIIEESPITAEALERVVKARLEERSRRSKVGGRKSKVGGRKSKVGGRESRVNGRKSKVGGRKSRVNGRKSKVKGRRSKVGNRESQIVNRKSYETSLA